MITPEQLIADNARLRAENEALKERIKGAKELLSEAEPYIPSTFLTQAINDFICSN